MVQMDVDLIVGSISNGLWGKFALGMTTRKFSCVRVFDGFLEDVCANGATVPYGRPRLFLLNAQCRLIQEIRVLKPHVIVFGTGHQQVTGPGSMKSFLTTACLNWRWREKYEYQGRSSCHCYSPVSIKIPGPAPKREERGSVVIKPLRIRRRCLWSQYTPEYFVTVECNSQVRHYLITHFADVSWLTAPSADTWDQKDEGCEWCAE